MDFGIPHTMVPYANDFAIECDSEGSIKRASHVALELLGLDPKDVAGRSLFSLVFEADQDHVRAVLATGLSTYNSAQRPNGRESTFTVQYRHVRNGQPFWVSVRGSVMATLEPSVTLLGTLYVEGMRARVGAAVAERLLFTQVGRTLA